MGIKISELPQASSVSSNDTLVVNHAGQTGKVALSFLMQGYMSGAGYLTGSDLSAYMSDFISEYLSEMVTETYLSEYLSECLSPLGLSEMTTLSEYLSEYLADHLDFFMSEYGYVDTESLSGILSSYMSDNNYMTGSDVADYLSYNLYEYLGDYVTQEYLSNLMEDYMTTESLSGYLSEKIGDAIDEFISSASEQGFVMSSTFASVMGVYLSEDGAAAIYSAISEYLNPSEE